jgi:hypothetical protein
LPAKDLKVDTLNYVLEGKGLVSADAVRPSVQRRK